MENAFHTFHKNFFLRKNGVVTRFFCVEKCGRVEKLSTKICGRIEADDGALNAIEGFS